MTDRGNWRQIVDGPLICGVEIVGKIDRALDSILMTLVQLSRKAG